jgi:hypothetical protein
VASWRKLLAAMVADPKPRSYSYDEAATVLSNLGFALATTSGTSHKRWRREVTDANGTRGVIIGLVKPSRGRTCRPSTSWRW